MLTPRSFSTLLALLCLAVATLGTASAATITVTTNLDSGTGSLRAAISNAGPGTIINFAANLSGQNITLTSGQLLVRSNLTIDASALASGVTISGNNASRVLMISNSATVVLKSLGINNGRVTNVFGAGIYNSTNCTLTLSNCVLAANSATNNNRFTNAAGGGVYNAGTLTLAGCIVSDNSAIATAANPLGHAGGGGLYNAGTATLTECQVRDNFATGGDVITLADGGIGSGGGIYNAGTLTLNRNTLQANYASGGKGGVADSGIPGGDGGIARGGGIYNAGSATVNQNTFAQNAALGGTGGDGNIGGAAGNGGSSFGGGIYNTNTGLLTLNQNTISANNVFGGYAGTGGPAGPTDGMAQCGGIFNTATGTNCTVFNCLIARNLVESSEFSSIPSPDVSGVFSSRGHNLLGGTNGSTGFTASGDLTGPFSSLLNPRLGPLFSRGGPTLTFAPLPGSPAIDAGDDSVTNSFATDQRGTGFARRVGTHVDIGAYETDGGSAPTIASVTFNSVTINPATHLASLIVRANVNPNSYQVQTTFRVQYGSTASYGLTTAPSLINGVGTNYLLVGAVVADLAPGFTWHFRFVATNHYGTNISSDQTFYISTGGIPGDADGDGFVTQSELDAVYANYVTNSPWLYMTNVAGLGNTNVLFSLSNSVLGAYSVQYTTNFSNWFNLGTATPRYLFTDTNAPANPKRYYRLRYP